MAASAISGPLVGLLEFVSPMLVGRHAEGSRVEELLRAARGGTSGTLVVRGEAGVGKTALLEHAAECADGFSVIRVLGVETEAELAYAALHQLVWPLFDRLSVLPAPQAAALSTVLGLSSDGDVDRLLLGASVLTLLAAASDTGPVLCLLDDAQWFDRASTEAIGFAARRLQGKIVVLLFAGRDADGRAFELPGIDELHLQPLEDADSHTLLTSAFGARITPEARKVLVGSAGGNPLALLEFAARAAAEGALTDTRPQRGSSVERNYAERIGNLEDDAQALLVLAAAESAPRSQHARSRR